MKTISLKLDDNIVVETEKILLVQKIPRNRYINLAIDYYNKVNYRKTLEEKLSKESVMVRSNSMEVLKDFEHFDYED